MNTLSPFSGLYANLFIYLALAVGVTIILLLLAWIGSLRRRVKALLKANHELADWNKHLADSLTEERADGRAEHNRLWSHIQAYQQTVSDKNLTIIQKEQAIAQLAAKLDSITSIHYN